ncbi:ubiquitin hypothetical protein [Limosa lapponica baueri]|uniref:UBFD1 PH-like C-terminal domain-containing protein n=1 Tax=Limosa lapponica baueri TaxID=1758121 RepID=A0A2I0T5R4_LIMLA|nr:ubiquitin hypothetical protein [Limosa lapponica baueri]
MQTDTSRSPLASTPYTDNLPVYGEQHRKVLDKGKPDDVMPSVKGVQERLPTVPLSGMYNKSGGKVRLTFKLEQDQLWIGTKVDKLCLSTGVSCSVSHL